MASQLKVDTITGVTTAGSISVTGEGNSTTTNLQQGLCKAWARLDGTGTIGLADSFNNASATDAGTGLYYFNFTNAFSNVNYAVTISSANVQSIQSGANTASQCKTLIRDGSGNAEDTDPVFNTNVGDLA